MKFLNVVMAVSAFSLANAALAPTVHAQQLPDERQSVQVPYEGSKVLIQVPTGYRRMAPDQYQDYLRRYDLSNGRILSLEVRGASVYARIDNERPHKLVVASHNNFVALDGKLEMQINLIGEDDATGWVSMVVPGDSLASGERGADTVLRFAMR